MKKKLKIFLTLSILLLPVNLAFADSNNLRINVDGKVVVADVAPQLKNMVTYVPISFIAKELGATVDWQSPTVVMTKNGVKMTATVGSSLYTRGQEQFSVKEIPFLHNDRVFVPLRIIGEQLGCEINYDELKKEINISSKVENTIPKPLPQDDNSKYLQSPNKKWGVKNELTHIYGNGSGIRTHIIYLKNNDTKEIKEIYSSPTYGYEIWTEDNQLLLNGTKDALGGKDRELVMLYNPEDKTIKNIAEAHGFLYMPNKDAVMVYDYVRKTPEANLEKVARVVELKTGKERPVANDEIEIFNQLT